MLNGKIPPRIVKYLHDTNTMCPDEPELDNMKALNKLLEDVDLEALKEDIQIIVDNYSHEEICAEIYK